MNFDRYPNRIVEEEAKDPETDLLSNWRHKTDFLKRTKLVQTLNLEVQKCTRTLQNMIYSNCERTKPFI